MKKQLLMIIVSLILSNDLNASEGGRGEHCFRARFQKKLKRVRSVELGSFKSLGLKQKSKKKEVFIDWRKLYWGNLKELIYAEEETYPDDFRGVGATEELNTATIDSVEAQSFAKELRQELKAFAKQYGFRIMWKKKSLDLPDATAAFIEYWDLGLSQQKHGKVVPFAELCSLSAKDESVADTSVKDTSVKNVKITNTKAVRAQTFSKGEFVPFESSLFFDVFLKGGA